MAIELRNLKKSFGDKIIFDNLNLSFEDGKTTCLMAPSGYGKTTLLRLLLGIEQPDGGEIFGLLGRRPAPVFQEDRLCDNLSAGANIRMVMPGRADGAAVAEALDALGMPDVLHLPARALSGGQRRRVALARALLSGGDLLLFDEPFQGLDHETRGNVAAYIRRQVRDRTLILVTHDEAEAALLGGVILRLDETAH